MAIADFARKKVSHDTKPVNIIEFSESDKYLGIILYPVQRFIFKLMYGLGLSDELDEPIVIRDEFNDKILYTFTSEFDFLQFLYDNKRINSMDIHDPMETLFFIGRRGTKSTMISIITAYTLYLVLRHELPQRYFRILKQAEIGVAITSNNKGNASKQLRETANFVFGSKWFEPFLVSKEPAAGGFFLNTQHALANPHDKVGKIFVSVFAASPSVRGSANIEAVLDEYAHYIDSDKSTKTDPLDEKVYDAITPSVAGFTTPEGRPLGKVFIATSPNGKKGNAYKKYKNSFDDPSVLMLHMPSNWVNPNLSSDFIRKAYNESEVTCAQEYWAEFVDSKHGYIKIEGKVRCCEDISIPNKMARSGKYRYYLGVDQALSTDSFSIAVVHYDPSYVRTLDPESNYSMYVPDDKRGAFVIDYIGTIEPLDDESLDIDMVINEVEQAFRSFRITKGGYDQWSKEFMEREFRKKGFFRKMEFMNASQTTNTEWAKMFKRLINSANVVWSPFTANSEGTTFSDEVLSLQEKTSGKYIKVEAPPGAHDDRYSAVTKALYLCAEDVSERNNNKVSPSSRRSSSTAYNKRRVASRIARSASSTNRVK